MSETIINCRMTVNKIGVDGTKSLVEVLKTNITLTSLKMNSKEQDKEIERNGWLK